MSHKPVKISCHVPDMDVSAEGIKDYYWPISNQERTGFGKELAEIYADLLKEHKGKPQILPYCFFGSSFMPQVVAVFQGDLLRERSIQDNVTVEVPEDWPYWPKLLREETPDEPSIISVMQNGPEKVSYGRKIFKFGNIKKIAKLLQWRRGKGMALDGLKIKPLTADILSNAIVATQRTPLIVSHAQDVKNEVIFCRSNKWYEKVSDQELSESMLHNNKILEQHILKDIAKLYQKYGIELKPHSIKFFQNLLDKGPAIMRVHYNRLMADKESLPRTIWTGTAGQYWDNMLRVAVTNNGGKACGHDHGSGCAYIKYPLRGLNEFWGCDEFVTFNRNHAEEMAEVGKDYPRYDDKFPSITSVKPKGDIKKIRDKYQKPKTVFIMVSLYDNDRGRIGPGNTNNFLIDWQVRHVAALKSMGYEVVIKIHPETKIMPPDFIEDSLGAKITREPFGNIKEQADVVIFDCIFTTAFTECLATNIPVVLIDFFNFPWTERGESLISKRCEIVKADYIDNRAQPNWQNIDKAIQNAPDKCENHEFYETYFL